ncbi:hypothetical protein Droror1_Dr00025421, partial [Drosera rotundifolia]
MLMQSPATALRRCRHRRQAPRCASSLQLSVEFRSSSRAATVHLASCHVEPPKLVSPGTTATRCCSSRPHHSHLSCKPTTARSQLDLCGQRAQQSKSLRSVWDPIGVDLSLGLIRAATGKRD